VEVIYVRERATASITPQQYAALEAAPAFWRLVEEGILSVERTRRNACSITATYHVGQAVVGDHLIRITEKIPGSLGALLLFASRPDAKIADAESYMQESDVVLFALIDRFLDMVERYLVFGRRKSYLTGQYRGSLPAGKIKVPETIRLWAKGRRDQVRFDRNDLSPRLLINQLIGLALCVVDGIIAGSSDDRRRRQRVRTNSMFFEDVGWQALSQLPPRAIDRLFRQHCSDLGDLVALGTMAKLFAMHFGTASLDLREATPFSWFVNLESLFEECIRKALNAVAPEHACAVTDFSAAQRFVFPEQRTYRAEPDIVLWRFRKPYVVADAKHKELDSSPSNPDVYQLVAHAKAWGVCDGALVYPGTQVSKVEIGAEAGGIRVLAFTANIGDLIASARYILSSLVPTGAQVTQETAASRP
jgi:5-methylcytosine-specific restriction endonuclease McrBC regulatory subunit McrC